jgi:hypothetical protein
MAQQPYMGSGLLLPPVSEVTKSCAFVAFGDWPTGFHVHLHSVIRHNPKTYIKHAYRDKVLCQTLTCE